MKKWAILTAVLLLPPMLVRADPIDNSGVLTYSGTDSAEDVVINNAGFGEVKFLDNSTADQATITNYGGDWAQTTFDDNATAADATITNDGSVGMTMFQGHSTAGNAVINNVNHGGYTQFAGNATAGNATITSHGDGSGGITFWEWSTAGDATISITADYMSFYDLTSGGHAVVTNNDTVNDMGLAFLNNSTAGNITITNNQGRTDFLDDTDAGNADITNNAGSVTNFIDYTSAEHATITNNSGGDTYFGASSYDIFQVAPGPFATAAHATIENNVGGTTHFEGKSSASHATITNHSGGTTIFGETGISYFGNDPYNPTLIPFDTATAGDATILTESGGLLSFINHASGGNAALTTIAGGTVSISGLTSAGTTAGSIAGDGAYMLGSKSLTVGSNDTDTEASGVISGAGGSLIKVGIGILTLSGNNTYTGGTTIQAGVLSISNDANLGGTAGALTFDGGGFLEVTNNITSNRNIILNTGTGLIDPDGFTTTLNGVISGDGRLFVGGLDDAGGTVVLKGTNTYTGGTTINGVILKAGKVNVLGSGNVDVGSSFSHVGELDLNGYNQTIGSLQAFTPGLVHLTGGAVLTTGGDNTSTEFSGTIDGTGRLVKTGSGVMSIYTANEYTGGTSINGGMLSIYEDDSLGDASGGLSFDGGALETYNGVTLAHAVTLNSGGGMIDTAGQTSTLTGSISGTGKLTLGGYNNFGGAVILGGAGNNSYSGGTDLNGETLQANAQNVLGTGRLTMDGLHYSFNAILDLNGYNQSIGSLVGDTYSEVHLNGNAVLTTGGDNTSTTYGGYIYGDGSLVKTGAGTLTLSGDSYYTGGTTILGGVLKGNTDSLQGNIINKASLIFDQSFTETFGGVISSTGSVTKTGIGNLTFSNSNTYSGGTTISAGTLTLGESNALGTGAITVASGATFDMNGRAQSGTTLTNNGTTNLKNRTLALSGAYSGTGTLATALQSSTVFGKMTATGAADISQSALSVSLVGSYIPKTSDLFDIVHVGSLAGTFASITKPAAYDFTPIYSSTGVVLRATQIPFNEIPHKHDNTGLLNALEQVRENPSGDQTEVIAILSTLSEAQLSQAMDQINPKTVSSLANVSVANSGISGSGVGPRLSAIHAGGPSASAGSTFALYDSRTGKEIPVLAQLAYNGSDLSSLGISLPSRNERRATSPWGFFATGTGSFGKLDSYESSLGNQVGYSFNSAGMSTGADYRLTDNAVLGGLVGYGASETTLDAGAGNSHVDSVRFGSYGTYFRDNGFYVNGYLGGALNLYHTHRNINFGGLNRTASGTPSGEQLDTQAELGYDYKTKMATLTPIASAAYTRVHINGFTETGADSLNMTIDGMTTESLRSSVGARLSHEFHLGSHAFIPRLSGAWEHEYKNQGTSVGAQFASSAADAFTVQTSDAGRDTAVLGAGLHLQCTDALSLTADYTGDFGRTHFYAHTFSGGFRFRF